jgi:hypothetical protein
MGNAMESKTVEAVAGFGDVACVTVSPDPFARHHAAFHALVAALTSGPVTPQTTPLEIRAKLLAIQSSFLASHPPGSTTDTLQHFPKRHVWHKGVVIRSLFIPAGHTVIGHIHRHAHWVALLEGVASVLTEAGGVELLVAPWEGISPAGTKRFLVAHTDTVWATEHLCDAQDEASLEAFALAPSYTALGMEEPPPDYPLIAGAQSALEEIA